ncbi:hypothetical protein CHS0354_024293 [Potamilus streckersoni]|uniref:Uncharacterized protein n=1 Tax=Potamilus streckersoni TaxID=2493646 RepID=A0AAE0RNH7_9BIVA|nr:hypothetical protein CHS0354_024293 [Potamilus streckersoni]
MDAMRKDFLKYVEKKYHRQSTSGVVSKEKKKRIIRCLLDPDKEPDPHFRYNIRGKNYKLLKQPGGESGDLTLIQEKRDKKTGMVKQYLVPCYEEMFDIIHRAHLSINHQGISGTFRKVMEKYSYVPRVIVEKYIKMCDICLEKHPSLTPILSKKVRLCEPKSLEDSKASSSEGEDTSGKTSRKRPLDPDSILVENLPKKKIFTSPGSQKSLSAWTQHMDAAGDQLKDEVLHQLDGLIDESGDSSMAENEVATEQRFPGPDSLILSIQQESEVRSRGPMSSVSVNNHYTQIMKELHGLQKLGRLCDITLAAEEGSIPVHRLILMASSIYCQTHLSPLDQNYGLEKVTIVGASFSDVRNVVNFIYTGKMELSQTNAKNMLRICQFLQIEDGVAVCQVFLKKYNVEESSFVIGGEQKCEQDILMKRDQIRSCSKIEPECEIVSRGTQTFCDPSLSSDTGSDQTMSTISFETSIDTFVPEAEPVKIEGNESDDNMEDESNDDSNENSDVDLKNDNGGDNVQEVQNVLDVQTDQVSEFDPEELDLVTTKLATIEGLSEINIDHPNVVMPLTPAESKTNLRVVPVKLVDGKLVPEIDKDEDPELFEEAKKKISFQYRYARHSFRTKNRHAFPKRKIKCIICAAQFENWDQYRDHRKTIHADLVENFHRKWKKYACDVCGWRTSNRLQFVDHKYKIHKIPYSAEEKVFSCPFEGCDFKTCLRAKIENHKDIHREKKMCEVCGKKYKSTVGLQSHMKKHQINPEMAECELCGKKFLSEYNLRKHIRFLHNKEKNQECDICKERFQTGIQLNFHKFKQHDVPLPKGKCYKLVKCPECDAEMYGQFMLARHMKNHEWKKVRDAYECPICERRFLKKETYDTHMIKVHDGEGSGEFPCHVCGKRFPAKNALNSHITSHSEKRFPCIYEGCNGIFWSKCAMKNHYKKVHLNKGDASLCCLVCKYTPSSKGEVAYHMTDFHQLKLITKFNIHKHIGCRLNQVIDKDGQLVHPCYKKVSAYNKKDLKILREWLQSKDVECDEETKLEDLLAAVDQILDPLFNRAAPRNGNIVFMGPSRRRRRRRRRRRVSESEEPIEEEQIEESGESIIHIPSPTKATLSHEVEDGTDTIVIQHAEEQIGIPLALAETFGITTSEGTVLDPSVFSTIANTADGDIVIYVDDAENMSASEVLRYVTLGMDGATVQQVHLEES